MKKTLGIVLYLIQLSVFGQLVKDVPKPNGYRQRN
jgi:hypothetical protein